MMSHGIGGGRALRIAVGMITLAFILLAGSADAKTLTVNASGGVDYTRIQDAINNSNNGDTILVYSGTYYENVNVNKQLILKGIDTGGGKPVVDASGNGPAIILRAGDSTLDGFKAVNSSNAIFPPIPERNIGIFVFYSSNNNTIINNTASGNEHGIYLSDSSYNNTLSNNNASNNEGNGIYLWDFFGGSSSYNNTLSNNIASSNKDTGIYVHSSNNNTLRNNTASDNTIGISLFSSNNTFTNNLMTGNKYNFGVDPTVDNKIDTSNLVNGKPIYFIKGATDAVYDSSINAGTFYCVNCRNVTIKNMHLNNNIVGISFMNTTNSRIQNVNASNNEGGISLISSSNNTLSGNNASNNEDGISLGGSNNTLSGNNVSNNDGFGIELGFSNNNTLIGNIASDNYAGIGLGNSSYNIVSGNNASNNELSIQFHYPGLADNNSIYNNILKNIDNHYNTTNKWNITKTNGTNIIGGPYIGGNFWASPNGTGFSQTCANIDSDGICDSPYTLDSNNIDYLPLAMPVTPTVTVTPTITETVTVPPTTPIPFPEYPTSASLVLSVAGIMLVALMLLTQNRKRE
jgi:nitrous oxidase accessory protein